MAEGRASPCAGQSRRATGRNRRMDRPRTGAVFRIDAVTLVRLMHDPRLTSSFKHLPEKLIAATASREDATAACPRCGSCKRRSGFRIRTFRFIDYGYSPAPRQVWSPISSAFARNRQRDRSRLWRTLADLAGASRKRGDDNFVLKRGALLHWPTSQSSTLVRSSRSMRAARTRRSRSESTWSTASRRPSAWERSTGKSGACCSIASSRNTMRWPSLWYRATSAWMQRDAQYNPIHLDHALAMFPNDADLLFLSGTQSETYAGPLIRRGSPGTPSSRPASSSTFGRREPSSRRRKHLCGVPCS